jgi:hypothetical protein
MARCCVATTPYPRGACSETRTPTTSVPRRRAAVITKQAWLAGLESNQRRSVIQSHVAPAGRATGHREPPPGHEPGTFRLQGGCAASCAKEAWCAREELNLHGPCGPRGPQPRASTVPPRAHASLQQVSNLLPAAYGAAALPDELWRHSWRPRARTWTFLIQGQACCRITPVSIGTGDASRTRMPRGLSSRGLPDCRHSRVRRQSLELRSPG